MRWVPGTLDTLLGVEEGEGAATNKPGTLGSPKLWVQSLSLSLDEDSTVLTTEKGESLQWGSELHIQMLVYLQSKHEFGFKSKHKTASVPLLKQILSALT